MSTEIEEPPVSTPRAAGGAGTVVVCAGGGGAPVVDEGKLTGVEAVVGRGPTWA
ncbi:hypothetical protein [Lentzea sp. NBRC 102530]|uniref:hypothetical protein n=1 Tax=Lentzea sp. NBRC 102530 TaxID=3032201 RepID=UPI002555408E|nr:hypothetical protein [Lentzea sp. NBRC 102530]